MKKKKVTIYLSIFATFATLYVATAVCLAQGGGGEEPTKKKKNEPPKSNPSKTEPKTKPKPTPTPIVIYRERPTAPTPLPVGDLTIRTFPTGSTVLLDGQVKGVTGSDGLLPLKSVKPGEHVLVVRKAAFQEDTRKIFVKAGQSNLEEVSLNPSPGSLSVRTNVAGARIEIPGVGVFTDQVSEQQLQAGTYQITTSLTGYKPDVKTVEIRPAEAAIINLTLNPITVAEMLAQAETDFSASRLDAVIETCKTILAKQPDLARANLLIGVSLYHSKKYAESLGYLNKAISAGEKITLPIKHHHQALMNDSFCTGSLTMGAGTLAFSSPHGFDVSASKLEAIRYEPIKAGRVSVDVLVQRGSKERKDTYNFHVPRAFTRPYKPGSSLIVKDCTDCQEETGVLYQLLQRLKQLPPPVVSNPSATPTEPLTSAPPSASGFQPYTGNPSFQLSIPAGWNTVSTTTETATFAPPQAVSQVQGKMHFTHGILAGAVRIQNVPGANLKTLSDALVDSLRKENSHLQPRGEAQRTTIAGREWLMTNLAGFSKITNRNETATIYSVLLRNGQMFFLIAVAPLEDMSSYQPTFQSVLNSVQFKD
jgi:hypothetical protein